VIEFKELKISWLGHDSFVISNLKTVAIDPFKIKGRHHPADVLLITHEHFDHCSLDDVKKVISNKTVIVTTPACRAELSKAKISEIRTVKPGDKLRLDGVSIEAVPAYNLNKFREPGKVFHPKEEQNVGYIIEMDGVHVYHAGDTDAIPEMKGLKTDVALLPVSGTYVMTAEEAAEAARLVRPLLAIPMHYGTIVGSERDAIKFKELAPCKVEILSPE
jgi:L-ascorbate metabolism protein UlaG (beta-lactamase superfamily)